MSTTKKKTTNNGIGTVVAGVTGAAMVAAGVAAVALSKKENREKAGKFINEIRAKGVELKETANEKLETVLKENENVSSRLSPTQPKVSKSAFAKN